MSDKSILVSDISTKFLLPINNMRIHIVTKFCMGMFHITWVFAKNVYISGTLIENITIFLWELYDCLLNVVWPNSHNFDHFAKSWCKNYSYPSQIAFNKQDKSQLCCNYHNLNSLRVFTTNNWKFGSYSTLKKIARAVSFCHMYHQ